MTTEPQPAATPPRATGDPLHDALASVEHALDKVADCTPEERQALAAEIHSLQGMLAKLRSGKVEIGGRRPWRLDQGHLERPLECCGLPGAGARRFTGGAGRYARA